MLSGARFHLMTIVVRDWIGPPNYGFSILAFVEGKWMALHPFYAYNTTCSSSTSTR